MQGVSDRLRKVGELRPPARLRRRQQVAARAGSLRSLPPLPSRKLPTAWSVFSSARPAAGSGALPLAYGHPQVPWGPLRGRACRFLMPPGQRPAVTCVPSPSTRAAVRRGPGGRLSKPACPPPDGSGSAGFAPTELLPDQSPYGLRLVGQNSAAPPAGRVLHLGCRPHFPAPRRPLRFASGSSSRPVKRLPRLRL